MKFLIAITLLFTSIAPAFANEAPMSLEDRMKYSENNIAYQAKHLAKHQKILSQDLAKVKELKSSIETNEALAGETQEKEKKAELSKLILNYKGELTKAEKSMAQVKKSTKALEAVKNTYKALEKKLKEGDGDKNKEQKSSKS
jgi:hypothetical protein